MHGDEPPGQSTVPPVAQMAMLTRLTAQDLVEGLGLADLRLGRRLLLHLASGPARRFARTVMAYDERVGTAGLAAGGAWAVQAFGNHLRVAGRDALPAAGPLLVLANHPGLCDTPALFAAIGRDDLIIIAADKPFLRALPHTSKRLLFVPELPAGRTAVVRAAARHLAAGGAVLTFPAGEIEPDPAVLPGSQASLQRWSDHLQGLLRFTGEAQVVPAIVSGVLAPRAVSHPLTRLRRRPEDQRWLAALLQILLPALQGVSIKVAFGSPLRVGKGRAAVAEAVETLLAEALRLIDQAAASPPKHDPITTFGPVTSWLARLRPGLKRG